MNLARSIWGDKKSKITLVSPMDFMPDWSGERVAEGKKPAQSIDQMKEIILAIKGAAKLRRRKKKRNK